MPKDAKAMDALIEDIRSAESLEEAKSVLESSGYSLTGSGEGSPGEDDEVQANPLSAMSGNGESSDKVDVISASIAGKGDLETADDSGDAGGKDKSRKSKHKMGFLYDDISSKFS